MKLMTKEIERRLPKLGATENQNVAPVIVKFFDPTGSWTWYAIEGERQKDGDWIFFGMVDGFEKELGEFSLNELITAKNGLSGLKALPIERDIWFTGYVLNKESLEVTKPGG
jgi:Protein of unknown function (DUF2958)